MVTRSHHAAVRAILGNMPGGQIKFIEELEISHSTGKQNAPADCLSWQPVLSAPADEQQRIKLHKFQVSLLQ